MVTAAARSGQLFVFDGKIGRTGVAIDGGDVVFSSGFDSRVRLALLCDYALNSEDGKVSAIGIFSAITFPSLPANYPRFFVVIVASLPAGSHTASLTLVGPNGSEIIPSGPTMELAVPEGSTESNLIIGFDNLAFETPGMHQLNLVLDETLAMSLPFTVMTAGPQAGFTPRGNA
jgi:hypothetical protein